MDAIILGKVPENEISQRDFWHLSVNLAVYEINSWPFVWRSQVR